MCYWKDTVLPLSGNIGREGGLERIMCLCKYHKETDGLTTIPNTI